MMEEYIVNLSDGTSASVWGYSTLDAKNYAIEVYGERYVSIGKREGGAE